MFKNLTPAGIGALITTALGSVFAAIDPSIIAWVGKEGSAHPILAGAILYIVTHLLVVLQGKQPQ
jgi:hypothetical protein